MIGCAAIAPLLEREFLADAAALSLTLDAHPARRYLDLPTHATRFVPRSRMERQRRHVGAQEGSSLTSTQGAEARPSFGSRLKTWWTHSAAGTEFLFTEE